MVNENAREHRLGLKQTPVEFPLTLGMKEWDCGRAFATIVDRLRERGLEGHAPRFTITTRQADGTELAGMQIDGTLFGELEIAPKKDFVTSGQLAAIRLFRERGSSGAFDYQLPFREFFREIQRQRDSGMSHAISPTPQIERLLSEIETKT